MDRIRLLAIGTLVMFAGTAGAQQTSAALGAAEKQSQSTTQSATDPVERHLKVLTEKLNLTPDQEERARPILREMHDAAQKAEADHSLSDEQRMEQVRAARIKADKQLREVLNDDQNKTLDQLEQEMHPELHGK